MATKCVLNKSTLSGIADAIRAKGGTVGTMRPGEMAAKISSIPGSDPVKDTIVSSLISLWRKDSGATIDLTGLYPDGTLVTTSWFNSGQLFRYTGASVIIVPWADVNAAYFIGNSATVTSITCYGFRNNAYIFGNGTNTGVVSVTCTGRNANDQLTTAPAFFSSARSYLPNMNVVHCKDADIVYNETSWVVTPR